MNGTLAVFFFPSERSMRSEKLLHIIAISQAGNAVRTLTEMQGFKAKKIDSMHILSRSCIFTP